MRPALFTFDIFGTIVDWRAGLEGALGRPRAPGEFDRVIYAQALDETGVFRTYREIAAASFARVLGVDESAADAMAAALGTWPMFADAREGLARLSAIAPCAAITNSDRAHGEDVRARLGAPMAWVCAQDVRAYKPDERMWSAASEQLGVAFGPAWWHVSAYADYDLATAGRLGLTTVFVERAHARPGAAHYRVRDLVELAELVAGVED